MLQIYAWASMLVAYSQDSSFADAARDTFSGNKPCELCKHIEATKLQNPDEPSPSLPALPPNFASLFPDIIPPNSLAELLEPEPLIASGEPGSGAAFALTPVHRGPPTPPPQC